MTPSKRAPSPDSVADLAKEMEDKLINLASINNIEDVLGEASRVLEWVEKQGQDKVSSLSIVGHLYPLVAYGAMCFSVSLVKELLRSCREAVSDPTV
jgi:hypothetical protein